MNIHICTHAGVRGSFFDLCFLQIFSHVTYTHGQVFVAHFLACAFYMAIPKMDGRSLDDDNWMTNYDRFLFVACMRVFDVSKHIISKTNGRSLDYDNWMTNYDRCACVCVCVCVCVSACVSERV